MLKDMIGEPIHLTVAKTVGQNLFDSNAAPKVCYLNLSM